MDFSGKLYRFKWALITLRLSPLTKSLGQKFPVTVYDNGRDPDPWTLTLVRECLYHLGILPKPFVHFLGRGVQHLIEDSGNHGEARTIITGDSEPS